MFVNILLQVCFQICLYLECRGTTLTLEQDPGRRGKTSQSKQGTLFTKFFY